MSGYAIETLRFIPLAIGLVGFTIYFVGTMEGEPRTYHARRRFRRDMLAARIVMLISGVAFGIMVYL